MKNKGKKLIYWIHRHFLADGDFMSEKIYSNKVDPEDIIFDDYFYGESVKLNIDCNKIMIIV